MKKLRREEDLKCLVTEDNICTVYEDDRCCLTCEDYSSCPANCGRVETRECDWIFPDKSAEKERD